MESQHIIYVITSLLVGRGGNVGYSVFFLFLLLIFPCILFGFCCLVALESLKNNSQTKP